MLKNDCIVGDFCPCSLFILEKKSCEICSSKMVIGWIGSGTAFEMMGSFFSVLSWNSAIQSMAGTEKEKIGNILKWKSVLLFISLINEKFKPNDHNW